WRGNATISGRHSGMVRRTRPGISRFRVRCCASPRNDWLTSRGFVRVTPCRNQAALGAEQRDDLGIGARAAEQKTLALVAAFGAQATQLGLGLDTLSGDGYAEPLAEADDGTDDRLRIAVGVDLPHERTVDLDLVEWEAAQIAQARIAGAEIVHRDAHAER